MERWKTCKGRNGERKSQRLGAKAGRQQITPVSVNKVPRDDNLSQTMTYASYGGSGRRDTSFLGTPKKIKKGEKKKDESTRHGAPQPIRGAFRWRMWALLAASIDLKRFLCMKAGRPQFQEGQSPNPSAW